MSSPPEDALRAAHAAAGARFGERRGQPVVSSYGDGAGEYAAARTEAGLVHLSIRALLEATGPQRQKFLQGMLSNDVMGRQPGQGCRAALLDAKGAVQALVRVLVAGDAVLLETDFDRIDPLRQTLEHHRVAAPVRFAVRPAAVLAVLGPGAAAVLRGAGVARVAQEPEGHDVASIAGDPVRVARASDLPGEGFVLHVPPESAAAVWGALAAAGARPVGFEALDTLRIETIRPWWGSDVTDENLLHETGLLAECHSPTKGCYLGQEVVARLVARGGHVNKALRGLRLQAVAEAGAPLTASGKDVGRVTTAAVSPRVGPIALGYVRRTHFAPGTAVEVNGAPATVVTAFDDGTASSSGG